MVLAKAYYGPQYRYFDHALTKPMAMSTRHRLPSVETVLEAGGWLFTARNSQGEEFEVVLLPCEDDRVDAAVRAWIKRCTQEAQRL